MSEIKVTIPLRTVRKLKFISGEFGKLNTGAVGDELWIGSGITNDYSWTQHDLGINKSGELIWGQQGGCSCNGPEEPQVDKKFPLGDEAIVLHENDWNDQELTDAAKDLIGTTDTLYKVLSGKKVTPSEIIGLPNAEIRRAVIELVGYDKLTKDAVVRDSSKVDGILMHIELPNDEPLVLLHVKDPSTNREYFLRVPPTMNTSRAARAWTFGFEAEDFELTKET